MKIIVKAPFNTPIGATLYLTGNIPHMCQWEPNCIELKQEAENLYSAPITFTPGMELKITRGSWETEASDSQGNAWNNIQIREENIKNNELVLNLVNWKDLGSLNSKGLIKTYPDFYSPELENSRGIHVRVPTSYYENPKKRYPVIYMHDGENAFDPATSTFGVPWLADSILENLENNRNVKEAIIVAIDSRNRFQEYDYELLGKKYAQFIIETLMPFINANYRTLRDRDSTYLVGSSMGAIISLSMLWTHSDLFSKAAGLSFPAFIHNETIFKLIQNSPRPQMPIEFYMDHGDYGIDAKYAASAKHFVKLLEETSVLKLDKNFDYRVFPYADHTEADWSRRLHIPLMFLLER